MFMPCDSWPSEPAIGPLGGVPGRGRLEVGRRGACGRGGWSGGPQVRRGAAEVDVEDLWEALGAPCFGVDAAFAELRWFRAVGGGRVGGWEGGHMEVDTKKKSRIGTR